MTQPIIWYCLYYKTTGSNKINADLLKKYTLLLMHYLEISSQYFGVHRSPDTPKNSAISLLLVIFHSLMDSPTFAAAPLIT